MSAMAWERRTARQTTQSGTYGTRSVNRTFCRRNSSKTMPFDSGGFLERGAAKVCCGALCSWVSVALQPRRLVAEFSAGRFGGLLKPDLTPILKKTILSQVVLVAEVDHPTATADTSPNVINKYPRRQIVHSRLSKQSRKMVRHGRSASYRCKYPRGFIKLVSLSTYNDPGALAHM